MSERFANALDLARGLAGDFRQLEENFKEIARSLAAEQAKPGTTKGRIVGHLLDTHAALKDAPHGQSFYAFWSMLSSPERQNRWRELIRLVYDTDAIDPSLRDNRLLERLPRRLLVEGERVVRSNERMAATLRRALETAVTGEDKRLRDLIREIQTHALARRNAPPAEDGFYELAGPPAVFAAFSRSFWQPEAAGRFNGELRFGEGVLDWDMVDRFRSLVDLNLTRLREHVRTCLLAADSVLLSQVRERFPPRDGILEVVGYLVVATDDRQHYVPGDQYTDVQLGSEPSLELWRVPEVLFSRSE